jgi:ribonuclease T2
MGKRSMMKPRPRLTLGGVVVAVLVGALWQYAGVERPAPQAARPDDPQRRAAGARGATVPSRQQTRSGAPSSRARFDFYLLALTLEPAFCEDGNQRIGQCRLLDAAAFERTPLVLHGLWPEVRQPGAWPRDCDGPRLALDAATRAELVRWMPGMREGLDRHEWRTHGTCTGLDDDAYFRAAIALTQRANAALGDAIRHNAGRRMTAAQLRAAADRAVPQFGEHLVLVCRRLRSDAAAKRRQPHLIEVRVCLDDDGPGGGPGSLLRCADVGRPDPGFGGGFMIDDL